MITFYFGFTFCPLCLQASAGQENRPTFTNPPPCAYDNPLFSEEMRLKAIIHKCKHAKNCKRNAKNSPRFFPRRHYVMERSRVTNVSTRPRAPATGPSDTTTENGYEKILAKKQQERTLKVDGF